MCMSIQFLIGNTGGGGVQIRLQIRRVPRGLSVSVGDDLLILQRDPRLIRTIDETMAPGIPCYEGKKTLGVYVYTNGRNTLYSNLVCLSDTLALLKTIKETEHAHLGDDTIFFYLILS